MNLNLRSLSVHVTVILQSGLQYFCSSAIWTHCPKLHSLFFSFFWWIKILIQHYTCMQLPNESNSAEVSILWGIRLNSWHWNWACLLYLYDWLRTKCCSWMWLRSFYYTIGYFKTSAREFPHGEFRSLCNIFLRTIRQKQTHY